MDYLERYRYPIIGGIIGGIAAIAIPAEAAPFASAVFIGEGIAIHIPGKIVCFQCIGELATGPAPVEGCLRKAELLWEIAIARCNLHDSFGGINLRVVDIIAELLHSCNLSVSVFFIALELTDFLSDRVAFVLHGFDFLKNFAALVVQGDKSVDIGFGMAVLNIFFDFFNCFCIYLHFLLLYFCAFNFDAL